MHHGQNRGSQGNVNSAKNVNNENSGTFTNFVEMRGFINFAEI